MSSGSSSQGPVVTEFRGTIRDEAGTDFFTEVRGRYRWLDEGSSPARIAGEIEVRRDAPGDLFRDWDVGQFRGRTTRLAIPGVGLSPVRIYSDGKIQDGSTWIV